MLFSQLFSNIFTYFILEPCYMKNLMHARMFPPDCGVLGSQSRCRTPVLKNCDTAKIGQESTFTMHTFRIIWSYFRFSRRGQLKCDATRAETRFRLSAKRTSPFKSAEASVQSTTGSRGVRISGSNAGYTMFRGSVKCAGYPLQSPVSPSLPRPCVTVCYHIPAGVCCNSFATSSQRKLTKFYYQPLCLCQGCFRTAKCNKFLAAKVCFNAGHGWSSCGDEFLRCNHIQFGFFIWENLWHVNLLWDRLPWQALLRLLPKLLTSQAN